MVIVLGCCFADSSRNFRFCASTLLLFQTGLHYRCVSAMQEAGIAGRWRNTIAKWVDEHVASLYGQARRPITFCVEGNVGAGKSTYLSMISDIGKCNEIQVVQEPVEQWQNVKGENLLAQFYKDPKRYAFTFQQYVLLTRINRVCCNHR
jgi:hypothetical protein